MSKKKIEKLLEETKLPNKISIEHKNNLKRKLNSSTNFDSSRKKRTRFLEYGFGGAVSIIFLIIFFSTNFESAPDINMLLNKAEMNYAGFTSAGNLNSFSNNVSVFGKSDEKLDVHIEQYIDEQGDKKRIIIKDKLGNEILDEYLYLPGQVYRTTNSKLFSHNTLANLSKKDSKMMLKVLRDSMVVTESSDSLIKKLHLSLREIRDKSKSYVVYERKTSLDPEGNIKGEGTFNFEVEYETNLDEYFNCNPLETLTALRQADSLHFIGSTDTDDNLVQIEKIIHIEKHHFNTLVMKFDSTASERFTKIDSLEVNYFFDDSITIGDTLFHDKGSDDFRKVERVIIDSESGEISGVLFFVERNDRRIKLAEVNFSKIEIISDPNIFNFEASEYSLVSEYKEL